ncbi:hypothetical protein EJ06DRAFT_558851 [Trichodelitschia bisporula]|uniref:Uncharacterized protein n=1 Tax=Trichodelitschia bisporula TaxID=703511 RepID=A0A6G1HPF8_9PEZI|nr:hypothetical protein EJ06DRAFT_558851 [Trichodelitschia bisporula]
MSNFEVRSIANNITRMGLAGGRLRQAICEHVTSLNSADKRVTGTAKKLQSAVQAKLELLDVQLDKLKSTVRSLLTVLEYARPLRDGVSSRRAEVQQLIREKELAAARYETSWSGYDSMMEMMSK